MAMAAYEAVVTTINAQSEMLPTLLYDVRLIGRPRCLSIICRRVYDKSPYTSLNFGRNLTVLRVSLVTSDYICTVGLCLHR